MNKTEIAKQLKKISVAFPSKKLYETKEDLELLIDLWDECLGDYTEEVVSMAIKNYVIENTYAPTIGDIEKEIQAIIKDWKDQTNTLSCWIRKDEEDIAQHERIVETRGEKAEDSWGYIYPKELEEKKKYLEKEKKELKELEEFKIWDD